ncbi:hypothetical protein [Microbacterium timonense]|uniref:hypothetical protein n=1 Tax=Microbacterium timonense TaxID=2086576 RepID=UPI000D0E7536|nr:hypothetical protein [Microbacterium timonense]
MSSITIDGVTVEGEVDGIAAAYEKVFAAIDRGDPVTVNLAIIQREGYTTICAFRVTAHTRLSAVLEYTPAHKEIHAEHSIAVSVR